MRRWFMLVSLLVAMALQTGCGSGMARTSRERQELRDRIFEQDMRQFVDDWDDFWLNDRPLRTSKWSTE